MALQPLGITSTISHEDCDVALGLALWFRILRVAINRDHLPTNERRLLAGEKNGHFCDIFGSDQLHHG